MIWNTKNTWLNGWIVSALLLEATCGLDTYQKQINMCVVKIFKFNCGQNLVRMSGIMKWPILGILSASYNDTILY